MENERSNQKHYKKTAIHIIFIVICNYDIRNKNHRRKKQYIVKQYIV
jgi:hypothetical protein